MTYKKPLIIALIFSLALTLLTMTLALAQLDPSAENENEEDEENVELVADQEKAADPPQVALGSGGPDAFGYVYADSNEPGCNTTFYDISGVGVGLGLSINGEANVTAPFPITLYDVTTTTLRIGNNGGLILGTSTRDVWANNVALPTTDHGFSDGPGIMPFWDSISDSSGDVYFATIGASPHRRFIVQWEDRPHFNMADTATFQVVFYEGMHKVDFVYEDVYFTNPAWDNGASATIGINQNGSNALQYSFDTASILTGTNPVSAICFGEVSLEKTVGLNKSVCAETDFIDVYPDTEVVYCYEIRNDTPFTRSIHSLVDSELGNLLHNFPYSLIPGGAVFLTETAVIDINTTNVANWTVSNPGGTDIWAATDSATVNVKAVDCNPGETRANIFVSDFEADNGGGVGSRDWEWGIVPAAYPPGLGGAHSGSNAWATVLGSHYNDLNAHSLLTFTIDLSDVAAPIGLGWYQYLQANNSGFDFAVINANGTTVYDSSGIPDEGDWTRHYADLDAYAGSSLTMVFDFFATDNTNDEGWYVDDVEIQYCHEPDSISFRKTVGLDSSVCAATDSIEVVSGTSVYYCYEVINNGLTTRSLHTLVDSELGTILNNFPYALAPSASVFVTQTAVINVTTVNTATWTADDPSPALVASDSATVTIVSIALAKTVGTDSSVCALSDAITVTPGTTVYYCYEVTNTGDAARGVHTLVDSELGTVLDHFPYNLAPGASYWITRSAVIDVTTINTATWSADSPGPILTASDSATVNVQAKVYLPMIKK